MINIFALLLFLVTICIVAMVKFIYANFYKKKDLRELIKEVDTNGRGSNRVVAGRVGGVVDEQLRTEIGSVTTSTSPIILA